MAYPVPIVPCDACDKRKLITRISFLVLRGHGLGHYCDECRDLFGEEEAE